VLVVDEDAELCEVAPPKPKNELMMPQTIVKGSKTSENMSDA